MAERCRIESIDTGAKHSFRLLLYCDDRAVGYISAHRAQKKLGGRVAYAVGNVSVRPEERRKGYATKLYEAAAAEACRRRASLASVERTSGAFSTDFWEKQVRKGRAKRLRGDRYLLTSCERPIDLGRRRTR